MSACTDKELLLHGLLDGELDAANTLLCEAHLNECAECAAEFARLQALRNKLRAPGVSFEAPAALRARIAAVVGACCRLVGRQPRRRCADQLAAVQQRLLAPDGAASCQRPALRRRVAPRRRLNTLERRAPSAVPVASARGACCGGSQYSRCGRFGQGRAR